MRRLPKFSVTAISLLLSFCSSIQNGYISSVLNIPQDILESFVNVSYVRQEHKLLTSVSESFLWSGIVTQRQIGQFTGTILSPVLTYKLGRKGTINLNTLFLCSGLLLQFISNFSGVWEFLLLGRFLWGTGCGVVAVVIPMFIAEISPNEFRGALASLHGMFIGFGSLLADFMGFQEVLGTENRWQYEYLIMIILQAFQLLVFSCWGKESPKDLYIRQGNNEKAIEAIKFYHNSSDEHVAEAIAEYEQEYELGSGNGSRVFGFLRSRQYRMSILVGVGGTACYAFGGMQIITTYSTAVLMRLNASKWYASWVSLGIGGLRFFAVFPSMYVVERFGRRKLLLGSVWGCIFSFIAIGICFFAHKKLGPSHAIKHLCAFAMLFYGASFSFGAQTVATFLAAELVPTHYRSVNQSFAIMFRFIIAFITTFSFLPLLRTVGWVAWLFLVVPLLLTALFMQKYMPETKNRTIQQILDQMNKGKYIAKGADTSEITPLLVAPRDHYGSKMTIASTVVS